MASDAVQRNKSYVPHRVMVFVDDANFINTASILGKQPDYLKLREFLSNQGEGRVLVEVVIYIGFPPQWKEEFLPQEWKISRDKKIKRRDFLEFNGFMTVAWFGKERGESEKGDRLYSANVDVLMAMDAMEYAFEVKPDVVVLVTGDQDFAYLAKKLRRKGIRVEVASVEQTVSPELKKAVNSFIDLASFFNSLSG
ncbi:MAG: NYN domain-containing protein [Magnetococcales bacterium]|nr:NYN domain-containing protein [Magnetococcales bacterium]MBF0116208.1 NYN domain-containing protein [Magnetococcales bacterium]